jgi:hypothetical protein
MKKNKFEKEFLDELSRVPIVQFACEKTGLSRQTIYRWRKEDKEFANKMDQATENGIAFVNDMSESQLLTMIKEGKFPAVRLWLTNNHTRYTNKLHITKTEENKELTKEQKATIKEALSLSINKK